MKHPAHLFLIMLLGGASPVPRARAQATDAAAVDDASRHFRRGVELFKEKDYAAALVEFRRAHELVPNWRVLYNIGKTQLELRDYVSSLAALQVYLSTGGDQIPIERRKEVEKLIEMMTTRVAKLSILSNADGAEVSVDDVVVGKTPLKGALMVNAGRRRITVFHAKGTRSDVIEIAGGDERTLRLDFTLAREQPAPAPAAPVPPANRTPLVVSVAVTSTLLLGTGITGFLALNAKNAYDDRLRSGPVTAADASSQHRRVSTLAAITDVFAVTSALASGVTIYLALRPRSIATAPSVQVGVGVGPGMMILSGRF